MITRDLIYVLFVFITIWNWFFLIYGLWLRQSVCVVSFSAWLMFLQYIDTVWFKKKIILSSFLICGRQKLMFEYDFFPIYLSWYKWWRHCPFYQMKDFFSFRHNYYYLSTTNAKTMMAIIISRFFWAAVYSMYTLELSISRILLIYIYMFTYIRIYYFSHFFVPEQ